MEISDTALPAEDYLKLLRALNEELPTGDPYIDAWCKAAITSADLGKNTASCACRKMPHDCLRACFKLSPHSTLVPIVITLLTLHGWTRTT
eukprot:2580568-Amphidinium_carterae.2